MESPITTPPLAGSFTAHSSRSKSSMKDDIVSLTSFNPFSEEDEHDQSSYTIVTSLFSRMKNTLSAPLSNATTAPSNATITSNTSAQTSNSSNARRPSYTATQTGSSNLSGRTTASERPFPLGAAPTHAAPPIVSLTPAYSELPVYTTEYDRPSNISNKTPYSPTVSGMYSPGIDNVDNAPFGTSIPGFPIADDARSIRTATSGMHRSKSVSKVIRRLRGEGLSRDYWMDDENCKECYDCKSIFTTWRRKHHCRICGQIFCSRCASNIIKGARFGSEGMLRVCNLCLDKLAKVEDDDDDDRRSIISSTSNFPAHQLPQLPYSSSQVFGPSEEPYNLYSITEPKKQFWSSEDDESPSSRAHTPLAGGGGAVAWEPVRDNPAPFRRAVSDEEKEGTTQTSFNNSGSEGTVDQPTKPIEILDAPKSSIQFPLGSPEHLSTPTRMLPSRPSVNTNNEFDGSTPFFPRSGLQSRFNSLLGHEGEPSWRTRRESTAYAQELNINSMLHLKFMLRQMLSIEGIPNIGEWEEVLLRLSLRIAREMTFTAFAQRQGQDMDVRRYVKIKKIPGGTPKDSEYVSGAVITKNVAHKSMSRIQNNPRVMLVTFPLEFSRVEGQYLHFAQIVRQEKEYLGNLASRIAALRPHIVLVEKSVSRIALEALAQHKIAVARAVKPSAIQTLARMTQGDIFSSIDKLAVEPRLGHCARYSIQTYDHPLIPGRRKTYMRFEGCNRDMGCTIILRGADNDTLKRIKKVTRFLTFIVRNLKLETNLWKDLVAAAMYHNQAIPYAISVMLKLNMPKGPTIITPSSSLSTPKLLFAANDPQETPRAENFVREDSPQKDADMPSEDAEQLRLTRRIDESLEPYKKTFISVSATLRFPPPYPILWMKVLDNMLIDAKREWEDALVKEERLIIQHKQEATITPATASMVSTAIPTPTLELPPSKPPSENLDPEADDRQNVFAQIEALPALDLVSTPLLTPDGFPSAAQTDVDSYFTLDSLPPTPGTAIVANPLAVPIAPAEEQETTKTAADIFQESRYTLLKWKHDEFRRIWEWYLRKNPDDFVVEKYQCIHLREYTIPSVDIGRYRPCFAPRATFIKFYGENDTTMGQFIEKHINDAVTQSLDPKAICTGKGCEQHLSLHAKVYVHNEHAISISVEKIDSFATQLRDGCTDREIGHSDIATFSLCRICGENTPFVYLSHEMLRYSFAKFLEIHAYPTAESIPGAGCTHNFFLHHTRYICWKEMAVKLQSDPVTLHEIVYPPFRIRVRPETQLELKNGDFQKLHQRNMLWYSSLIDDLKLISIDAATGDEERDAVLTADINVLILRAEAERQDISKLIDQTYRDSAPTDTLALNRVHAYRQDKIVAWQMDFDRLPKPRSTQGTNRNSNRSSAFDSMRAMWPTRRSDLAGAFENPNLPSSSVSEAEEELPSKLRRMTVDSSSASDASETEWKDDSGGKKDGQSSNSNRKTEEQAQSDVVHTSDDQAKSDPDSDSTIGAPREKPVVSEDAASDSHPPTDLASQSEEQHQRPSRLPRRASYNPSVAELVKKYQDYIPASGIQDLAETAMSPKHVVSESEQEYRTQMTVRPSAIRTKSRHRLPIRMPSTSDFEQGYAANVAPKYLSRRPPNLNTASRIPGPKEPVHYSPEFSRRGSPEKRSSRALVDSSSRPSSPPAGKYSSVTMGKQPTKRVVSRTKDKSLMRPTSSSANKATVRRAPAPPGSKVSNIAKHFERLGRDAERSKSRYAVIRGRRARPVASARAKVEVLDSVKDAIRDESESSDSSSEADDEDEGHDEDQRRTAEEKSLEEPAQSKDTDSSSPTEPKPPTGATEPVAAPIGPEDDNVLTVPPAPTLPSSPMLPPVRPRHDHNISPPASDLEGGAVGPERNSILKALSGFWTQPTRHSMEADDVLSDPEHIFRDSSMVVRLDEPTSIIALALSSTQYRDMLNKSRSEKKTAREARLNEMGETFMPDNASIAESNSTWGMVNLDTLDAADPTDDLRAPSSKLPWAITFESGGLTISCTVLYPEQFDALRRTYDCEKSMVESLSRCFNWNATGGKSGSAFLKTRDDRFIAKELSKPELQTMETFAPAYFDYMSSSVNANRPTLLAKVFGCFKVSYRKSGKDKGPNKSKSMQINLLVMENLFYDKRFSKIYDLKGSTRNRHVRSTGRENEVLLDENLVEAAYYSPLNLREHSKRILRGALYNDSKFLADINVMDYSLVCGVDSSNNELVIGIVDYIRTYTWDKKLESWVKESAFLGGAGKGEPTIVTPKQYRSRFLGAMERYFPLIPDRWMKQNDTPEEESVILSDLWPDW